MSKKKTPPEKKEAEYARKNYLSFHHAKSTRKGFRVQKRLASKTLRSKTDELTRRTLGMDCNLAAAELEDVTTTLIKSGLSKKRIRKFNVLSLREKVRRKTEERESRHDWNIKRKEDNASRWHRIFERLLADDTYSDSSITDARELLNDPWLHGFLENEPIWRQKLETWLDAAEKSALRREQKKIETAAAAIRRGTSEIKAS